MITRSTVERRTSRWASKKAIAAVIKVLTILAFRAENILTLESDVCRRASHQNAEFARRNCPVVLGSVVVRKSAAIEQHGDLLAFSGTQGNLCEALQFLGRPGQRSVGIANIHLRNFGPLARASVFHVEANREQGSTSLCGRSDFQVAVSEGGVRKSVAKGKQRLSASFFIATVAHKDSFAVFDALVALLRVVAVKGGIFFPPAFKRSLQFSRWAEVAEENLPKRRAALLPRIPGMQNRGNLIKPLAHIDVSAGIENNDYILVYAGDLLDEDVLTSRTEGAVAPLSFGIGIESHAKNYRVSLCR